MSVDHSSGTIGKPRYTLADLYRIDNIILMKRLARIDNPLAHRIADVLYTRSGIGGWTNKKWRPDLFMLKDGSVIPGGEIFEERPIKLRKLTGWRPQQLLSLLNRLQQVSFRDLIADGPEAIREKLDTRPALLRLLFPTPRLEKTVHIPGALISQLEFLIGEKRSVPWVFLRALIPFIPAVTSFGPILPFIFREHPNFKLAMIAMVPSVLLGLFVMSWIQNYDRQRLLALYISFTDEFISAEEVHG
jgi:hypothetical protein